MACEYSEKDKAALKEFRQRIEKLKPQMTEEQLKDYNLMRWIRAREFNLEKAEEMLHKNLQWRKQHDMENIMKWTPPEHFKDIFPYYVSGKDKDGSYVNISPIGTWDIRKVVETGYGEQLKIGTRQYLETVALFAQRATEESGKAITQYVTITDMEGYSMTQLLSSQVRESNTETMKLMEANYPELLKRAFVINAPKVFTLLFNLIKPFMSDHTVSKIQIFDSNREKWSKALLEHIDPDELPSNYGGTNTACSQYLLENGFSIGLRAPNFPADVFLSVAIPAASEYKVEVKVDEPNTTLSWNFRTDDYDIGFKFLHGDKVVYHVRRCDSHLYTQKGAHLCEATGTYTLVFDNKYSKMRAKTLYYYVDSKTEGQGSS